MVVAFYFEENDDYGLSRRSLSKQLNPFGLDVVAIANRTLSAPGRWLPIIKDALKAKKHVLSQKPFVLDINDGKELVDLAKANKVKLAVNQNGRWAPHFSYMRNTINAGLIGRPLSVNFSLHWDQRWITGNPAFETILIPSL